jgi:ABC-type phosphate transport system substrate-binding protein
MNIFQSRSRLAVVAAAPVIALTIALISGAFIQHASAQHPKPSTPFAVGGFTTMVSGEHVAFAAHFNAAHPGYVVQQFSSGLADSGPITCLTEGMNGPRTATITFYVKNGPDVGTYRTFKVADNGEPTMQMSTDMYQDCGTDGGGGCSCQNGYMESVLRGNIVVGE